MSISTECGRPWSYQRITHMEGTVGTMTSSVTRVIFCRCQPFSVDLAEMWELVAKHLFFPLCSQLSLLFLISQKSWQGRFIHKAWLFPQIQTVVKPLFSVLRSDSPGSACISHRPQMKYDWLGRLSSSVELKAFSVYHQCCGTGYLQPQSDGFCDSFTLNSQLPLQSNAVLESQDSEFGSSLLTLLVHRGLQSTTSKHRAKGNPARFSHLFLCCLHIFLNSSPRCVM